jgi:hypothetical protein
MARQNPALDLDTTLITAESVQLRSIPNRNHGRNLPYTLAFELEPVSVHEY